LFFGKNSFMVLSCAAAVSSFVVKVWGKVFTHFHAVDIKYQSGRTVALSQGHNCKASHCHQ
jgi:hypothetical protein